MNLGRWQDFAGRFEAGARDPEQVVRLLVEAMLAVEDDAELGEQMLCVVIARNKLSAKPAAASGFAMPYADQTLARLKGNPHIARALAGGTPGARYADADLARFALDRAYSSRAQGVGYPKEGQAKLFVACSGADTPRPVTLARNDSGMWKLTEWSSVTVGVKAVGGGDF